MTGHFLNSLPKFSSGSHFVVRGTPIVTSGCDVADLDNAVAVCNDLTGERRHRCGQLLLSARDTTSEELCVPMRTQRGSRVGSVDYGWVVSVMPWPHRPRNERRTDAR